MVAFNTKSLSRKRKSCEIKDSCNSNDNSEISKTRKFENDDSKAADKEISSVEGTVYMF